VAILLALVAVLAGLSRSPRSLANLKAVIGPFYLAITVTRLVTWKSETDAASLQSRLPPYLRYSGMSRCDQSKSGASSP